MYLDMYIILKDTNKSFTTFSQSTFLIIRNHISSGFFLQDVPQFKTQLIFLQILIQLNFFLKKVKLVAVWGNCK